MFYSAPTDSKGNVLICTATLPGSEIYWDRQEWLGSQRHDSGSGETFNYGNAVNRLNNAAFESDSSLPLESLEEFDFDTIISHIGYMEAFFPGANADLEMFGRNGGKLILTHGWLDVNVRPHFLLDYYRRVVIYFGQGSTERFFKLFMTNRQNHTQEQGVGASSGQDTYARIAKWVEDGIEPTSLNGKKYSANSTFEFSRRPFPFPNYVMHDGVGDPKPKETYYPVKELILSGISSWLILI